MVDHLDPANTRRRLQGVRRPGRRPRPARRGRSPARTGAAFVPVVGAGHRRRRPRHAAQLARHWPAAFAEGAAEAGADVVLIGLASTDQLYFASGHLGHPGAMFTASHNPAQYNGIKLCRAGAPADRHGDRPRRDPRRRRRRRPAPARAAPGLDRRARRARRLRRPPALPGPGRGPPAQGRRRRRQRHGRPHRARPSSAGSAPSGRAGADVLRARRHLPATTRPTRSSRRTSSTSRSAVVAEGADLGLAFDGDADRCFLVDERGDAVSPSTLTALIAARELAKEPGADGDPQPDHQPRRARDRAPSSAARRCAPGSGTPSSRRRWPRPTRSSAASTAATSTSATSGAPTPACSPRCTRWPRWPRPTGRCRELLADYERYVAQRRDQLRRSPTRRRADGRRRGGVRRRRTARHVDHLDGLTVDHATTGGSTSGRPTPSRCCASTSRAPTTPPWPASATTSSP